MGNEFSDIMDLMIPFETIEYAGNTYKLNGLGLPHIVSIVRAHGTVLGDLFIEAGAGQLEADASALVMRLGDDFSAIASGVIACAMGNPAAAKMVVKLPLLTQIEALDKIIKLTLVEEGGAEKILEIVVRVMEGAAHLKARKP